jgi:hypothetical protein
MGEVLGGAGQEAAEYKVPVFREQSANLPRIEDEPVPVKPVGERLQQLTQNVRELGLKALDHLHGVMGGEQDRHLRLIERGLHEEHFDLQEDTTWLHTFEQELDAGIGVPESLQHEIKIYEERIGGREAIIRELTTQRDHAQWQDTEAPNE